jgi:transposase
MDKIDTRKQNQQTQYELRKQVIRLRKKGYTNLETADITGLSKTYASTVWQSYLKRGLDSIKPGTRGRRHGSQRKLNPNQEKIAQKMLIDKTPDQLKLPFALWSREAIRQSIKNELGIDLPLRTITDYLKRWCFTPQKPTKRAYEQDSEKISKWLDQEFPEISRRAKEEKAEIHWGDETGVNNSAYYARGFAPKGHTPVVRLSARKCNIGMISSITNQGKVRFMLYKEAMNSQLLIKFLSRLVRDADKKIFLILDNLRVHHSKIVQKWLKKHEEKIEVFFLPPYAPEYNPDEYLNGDMKRKIRSGIPPIIREDVERKTRSFMKTLQKRPKHVSSYFKHEMVKYAG